MKLKLIILITIQCIGCAIYAQQGLFIGINGFAYKSNFYNVEDLHAKNELDYIKSYNASYGLEFGYRFGNNISLSAEIQSVKNTQKYEGRTEATAIGAASSMTATSQVKCIKIPVNIQYLSKGKSKLRWIVSSGAFYSYLSNYSENINFNQISTPQFNTSHNFTDQRYTLTYVSSGIKKGSNMERFAYNRNFLGVHLGTGLNYNLNSNIQILLQVKSDYTLNDIEYKERINTTPDPGTGLKTYVDVFNNSFVKYQNGSNREATHLFNLGFSLTLRFLLNNKKIE